MKPHPLIHLICVLLLAFSLAAMDVWASAAVVLLLAGVVASHGPEAMRALIRSVWRLRYLLLSIVMLAWWFDPGDGIADGGWRPSHAALLFVTDRVLLLIGLVAAAESLRLAMPVPVLASALTGLLTPLRPLGVNPAPFARRTAMTLAAVPWARDRAGQLRGNDAGSGFERIGAAAAALIADAESRARENDEGFNVPALPPPAPAEWSLPLLVALLLALLGDAG